jgi:hypothetical protein
MTGITLTGTVCKLIDRSLTRGIQQAQISLVGADAFYDEIRIPNTQNWDDLTGDFCTR